MARQTMMIPIGSSLCLVLELTILLSPRPGEEPVEDGLVPRAGFEHTGSEMKREKTESKKEYGREGLICRRYLNWEHRDQYVEAKRKEERNALERKGGQPDVGGTGSCHHLSPPSHAGVVPLSLLAEVKDEGGEKRDWDKSPSVDVREGRAGEGGGLVVPVQSTPWRQSPDSGGRAEDVRATEAGEGTVIARLGEVEVAGGSDSHFHHHQIYSLLR
ncbi:hypothetical protein BKA70DRAFT_1220439 [Coprinopsis sp. MPI-PUGE-AT-0042]|nr:hypothetical protein BKA70DRAFT_1220439 [Coprinopsis sp. MPI-PUGE-AT-0042]